MRKVVITNNETYHIFNRGIDKKPTFTNKREYERALLTLKFYRFVNPPLKLSRLLKLNEMDKKRIFKDLRHEERLVDIFSFCLMPNHFHFLLRQASDRGISRFISQFENSYTRYFNTKNEKEGPLFLDQFKAVWIEDDSQLVHVSRYIHLNPITSYVVKDLSELQGYPWSSYPEYTDERMTSICDKKFILSFYKTANKYKEFVTNRVDY